MISLNLNLNLNQILDFFKNNQDYYWSIIEFEGSGYEAYVFEKSLEEASGIVIMNSNELWSFENRFTQIINLIIFGDKDCSKLTNSYENSIKECEIRIELVDSTLWELSVKNIKIENLIKRELKDYIL